MQVDIITKEETGLERLNILSQLLPRAKIHVQVGQPPNLALFELQKNLAYKIASYPQLSHA